MISTCCDTFAKPDTCETEERGPGKFPALEVVAYSAATEGEPLPCKWHALWSMVLCI